MLRLAAILLALFLASSSELTAQRGSQAAGVLQGVNRGYGAFRPANIRPAPRPATKVELSPSVGTSSESTSTSSTSQSISLAARAVRDRTNSRLKADSAKIPIRRAIPVSSGVSRSELKAVQRRLQVKGYYYGGIDGVYDRWTRTAIENFQRDNGIQPNGMVNALTLNLL